MIHPVPKPKKSGPRARTPIARKGRMKKVNRKRGGSSFPKRRDYKFQAWVRENAPCILARQPGHRCNSPVRCCHIVNQARGGYDLDNIYGGCDRAHDLQHHAGSIVTFDIQQGVNCQREATLLTYWYQEEMR